MFVILTSNVRGPVDSMIAPFLSEGSAGEYLEKNGWHRSIGNWWSDGNRRAMVWLTCEPPPNWKSS